jgi:hypothetical protein
LSRAESNPVYDIIDAFKLLFKKRESNTPGSITYTQAILSKVQSIFSSEGTAEVFTYFCLHGASTAWGVQCQLEMTEPTAYRALKHLRSLKIIVPALKIGKNRRAKGGPRPTVWALENSSPDEVAEALRLHYRLLSPNYRIAEKVAQTILDEYHEKGKPPEITYREIVIHIRELKIPFTTPDIADLAAQYLHEKGIKVWR